MYRSQFQLTRLVARQSAVVARSQVRRLLVVVAVGEATSLTATTAVELEEVHDGATPAPASDSAA